MAYEHPFSLAGIIMVVIIIGSVALIYNAFAICVSERTQTFRDAFKCWRNEKAKTKFRLF